jgi:hypothetical protein
MIQLPESMFRIQLTFQYSLPPLTLASDDTAPFSLSFVCPSEVPVSHHRIHFFMPPGYRVELQNESKPLWESYREPRRPTLSPAETFRSVLSPSKIALLIYAPENSISGTTIVERAWLQTWLTGALRRDRAMYILKSTNDAVTLQLPPEAVREHRVFVRVDQEQIPPNISSTGALTIPILPEQHNRLMEIAVEYRYSFEMSGFEVPMILPSFTKETPVQYQFWQIIIPQGKHIIGCPVGWTLEYDWAWNGLFWWRVPSIRKSDLGFTSNSTAAEPALSESSHYVFSHLQPPSYVTLYIVKRSLIILCASSIALLIGLVFIYVPQSRYAGSLFGLGIASAAVLLYQPPLVLLMLQAAVFGVFLALTAGYMYRIFHHQQQWISPTFPLLEDLSQPYLTPVPQQTVHEVVMDEGSTSKDVDSPALHNGQS